MEPSAGQPKAADSKPEAKGAPKPEAKAETQPDAETELQAKTDVATLLNTSLGDLLVAGLIKDPEDAGRIIAAALTQAKASGATAKSPEADAEDQPDSGAESKQEVKAKSPSGATLKTDK